MKIKSYVQNPSGDRVEMTADNDIYLKTFTQEHSSGPWIMFAIDDCNLWNFLYYLYLYCITEYTDKEGFADDKKNTEIFKNLVEHLKDNKIDADTLTFLRDTLLNLKDTRPEPPVVHPKVKKRGHSIETYSVEDALGKYYNLAVEALGCCDYSKYVKPYLTESSNLINGYDDATGVEYELVCTLPRLSWRSCALAELEDTGVIESKWFENDRKDGVTALYRHLQELSAQSNGFDDRTMCLLDLAARCLEPFVTGQIGYKRPISMPKPSELFKKLFDDEV